jgi:hypothetical protein
MTTFDKLNALTNETSKTLWDGAALAQKQNVEFAQQWLNAIDISQRTSRDLAGQLLARTHQAQGLWFEFLQENYRASADAFTKLTRGTMNEASEQVRNFARQSNGAAKKTETAAATK